MELPARLCALWALLLCAGGGGDAVPAGECGPPGRGQRPRGGGGSGREAGEGSAAEGRDGNGRRGLLLDAQRWATAVSGVRFQVGNPGAAGLSGSRAATAGREDEDSPPLFPRAVGNSRRA